ncbi:protein CMSS1 isoform X2 [Osmerus eperlanus]|uniref:protein CMSS1 isoform X2 n=1 Tax=Osmerus eperlanus TaxID=29151 RepID=UPI002E16071E
MGDDLGEEWWEKGGDLDVVDVSEKEEVKEEKKPTLEEAPSQEKKKRKRVRKKKSAATEAPDQPTKKKKTSQKECFVSEEKEEEPGEAKKPKKKRRKKTITDVLATSEPKAGSPVDLQNLVVEHFSDKRSVIEMEDLNLLDSCFLSCNDLTHSLSSYLKEICPKWAKVQKQHTEKGAVVLLIVCSSALRTIELIKQLTTFKGTAKALKLFAKHIKVEEQVKFLQREITHIGVGTPGRLQALVQREGLNLQLLRFLVLDWNWRDQKQRRMVDVPEIKFDLLKLLDVGILNGCREGRVRIGLF